MSDEPEAGRPGVPIEVLWRVGDPACREIRGMLLDHGVEAVWRNVALDAEATALVEHAGGKVPIVLVGEVRLVDPNWADLAPLLGRDPRERPKPPPPRPYASAGACRPADVLRYD